MSKCPVCRIDERSDDLSEELARAVMCTGKHGYPTRHDAQRGVHHARGAGIQIYRCRFCNLWHLGGGVGAKSERRALARRRQFRGAR